ncbi:chorion class high-cysteine HCB protein 13 [Fusibacillus kribbianus]|uniref:Chorion class high-cysteine HCB protein 13 n=1 Tax=Fusibacillus kribbianus TaxID=3044208 RepID=A0AAP4BBX4_9FIRM|nr:chorion class high-cysteine HCB protein 13 [Ruminococcus sp. YH-rum2234]MDI9242363.1 chorion class high-cysteine HCB protein 13 [Ruminococcus sp. YH-rum2234]
MSDLAATNCGCPNNGGCSSGGNNILFLLLILCLCGHGDCDDNCGFGFGSFFGGDGCNSCSWLIWILILSCFCNH